MSLRSRFTTWWAAVFHNDVLNNQLSDELAFHIESRAEELMRSGLSREQAHRRARAELGSLAAARENLRQAWGTRFFDELRGDLRYAVRILTRSPGFSAVAVGSLALGIGANTVIFSMVNAVLLRPLPFPHGEQLTAVMEANEHEGGGDTGSSFPDYSAWRAQTRTFSAMAGYQFHDLTLTGFGEPSVLHTVVTTSSLFPLLGINPVVGRTFSEKDGERGAAAVVVLSEQLWRSQLAANPSILGKTITLDQRPFTVIGIMPASFHYPLSQSKQDLWIPLAQDPLFGPWMTRPGGHWLRVVGRLRDGVTLKQARAEMVALEAGRALADPADDTGWTVHLKPLHEAVTSNVRLALWVVLGAVSLVLLIACANIANLLLARATARSKEMAMRVALGADRRRIARQLLTESAVLGLAGAALGVALAWMAIETLRAALAERLPQIHTIAVDRRVLFFALVLSVATSLLFGLAPVLFAGRSDPQMDLAAGARSGVAQGPQRARKALAVVQIALAMMLLAGTGLLMRSFLRLTSVAPGFIANGLVKASISLPRFQYSTPQQWSTFSVDLLRRLHEQPGLRQSAMVAPLPILDGFVNLGFLVEGAPPPPPGVSQTADYVAASPEYFSVMGIPLQRGRRFDVDDGPSRPPVALISAAFAQRYFPHENPLGRRVMIGFPPDGNVAREVVGVVGDVRDATLSQNPGPMVYVPFAQAPFWGGELVVKSSMDVAAVAAALREQTKAIDRGLPVTDVESLAAAMNDSVTEERFRTRLLAGFSALALLLAAGGIFGVMSYSVSRRTNEIGIRMALGAQPRRVLRMVLSEASWMVAFGVVAGLAGALALGRLISTMLYGLAPWDPATFALAGGVLIAVALAASWIPARRAAGVDPMKALRHE
ncbi:MAG TPA: ABC transporter permease [Acidobacteriaceae bacterium]|nr:ABC transporter permease [Acidobacteriaceae bacterium]